MTPAVRRGLTAERIVSAALDLLDEDGLDALTTTRLARRLGVSQPALYSHFRSVEQLQREVAVRGARELSGVVQAAVDELPAGADADAALTATAHAYRGYVKQHPDRYLLQLSAPRDAAFLAAAEQSAEAVRSVLRRFGLSETQVRESHLAFRAAVHGFVHLEAHQGLAADAAGADRHFEFFVGLFAAGLHAVAGRPTTRR